MKKLSSLLLGIMLFLIIQGCAVYTPYAPVGYSYPAYNYGYRPHHYGPGNYGWGGHHHGWRGGGYGWGGHHGWHR
jgi:hypothetical protein